MGAKVEESKLITDPSSNISREADILISLSIGTDIVYVAIEVRDHKRKQDVKWIDEVAGKWSLFGFTVCTVSSSGYTDNALTQAEKRGIHALTWEQAASADWTKFALADGNLSMTFRIPKLTRFLVETIPTVAPNDLPHLRSLQASVSMNDLKTRTTLRRTAELLLKINRVNDAIQELINEGKPEFSVRLEASDQNFMLLFPSHRIYRIKTFVLIGHIETQSSVIEFQPFRLGKAEGAWGSATTDDGGSITAVVTAKESGGSTFDFELKGIPRIVDVDFDSDKRQSPPF